MNQKTGNEHFFNQEKELDYRLSDFWRWYASSLLHGALRGAIAEYIVSRALDIPTNKCRQDWEAYDLLFGDKRIEVKSCAYYQSENQDKPSRISFDISKHIDMSVTGRLRIPEHYSDIYIFCILGNSKDKSNDPMDVSQWSFYILRTSVLDRCLGDQKTITLSSLISLEPVYSTYGDLKQNIESVVKDMVI